jgi:hypothetical protein
VYVCSVTQHKIHTHTHTHTHHTLSASSLFLLSFPCTDVNTSILPPLSASHTHTRPCLFPSLFDLLRVHTTVEECVVCVWYRLYQEGRMTFFREQSLRRGIPGLRTILKLQKAFEAFTHTHTHIIASTTYYSSCPDLSTQYKHIYCVVCVRARHGGEKRQESEGKVNYQQ